MPSVRKLLLPMLILSLLLSGAALPGPASAQDGKTERTPIYDETTDGRVLVSEALERASRDNKRVLIQWGGNWCTWCYALHDLMTTDREVRTKLLYEYEVVLMDIGHMDRNTDLAEEYGADLRGNGVPYLTILAADGSVVTNQTTVAFEDDTRDVSAGHDPQKLLAWLTEHQAEYPPR